MSPRRPRRAARASCRPELGHPATMKKADPRVGFLLHGTGADQAGLAAAAMRAASAFLSASTFCACGRAPISAA